VPGGILGTAGHIDHGKTALVRALTGVDTDRLKEEKARGITIDLGFAELALEGDAHFGVVDVPGHEGFVRTMVAGASGMDVVLLVVAADEGIMPQTREHLSIVELLGVPAVVVALTKADLVEPEWLELVDEEVRELLASTPYADAPRIATSVSTGEGIDALRRALAEAARRTRERRRPEDLARLPVDRVFTVQGTGTVVTGTLWSGTLAPGMRVSILPGNREARIRGAQAHGRDVERAVAGDRTAVALAGPDADLRTLERGSVLVTGAGWRETWMLTVRARVLEDARWSLAHNQRVRVLLGTSETMARCAMLEDGALGPGEEGWIQLRLEAPTVARAGDRTILRAYSPMETLGGAIVVEPAAPKRRRLDARARALMDGLLAGIRAPGSGRAVPALATMAGWKGVAQDDLPVATGEPLADVAVGLAGVRESGGVVLGGRVFSASVIDDAKVRLLRALAEAHAAEPLRPVASLETLRVALPTWSDPSLADGVLAVLAQQGRLELVEGGAREPGFQPRLTRDQEEARGRLVEVYAAAALAPPFVHELPPELARRPDLQPLLRHLAGEGRLRGVAEGLYFDGEALRRAEEDVASELGGRTDLGPADFRDVLPVSRKHLLPLLQHLDGRGVTVRRGDVRDVPLRR
jgi:selenocysteine-specific elongation factor